MVDGASPEIQFPRPGQIGALHQKSRRFSLETYASPDLPLPLALLLDQIAPEFDYMTDYRLCHCDAWKEIGDIPNLQKVVL